MRSPYQGLSRSRSQAPRNRARTGVRLARQKPRMTLSDVEDNRPGLEEGEIAFFISRNLPKRMKPEMEGLLHLAERNKADVVRLPHFFKRPANAHITRQSPAAIGRVQKAVIVGVIGTLRLIA